MYFTKKRKLKASIVVPLLSFFGMVLSVATYALYRMEDTITSALCPPVKIESLSSANAADKRYIQAYYPFRKGCP